MERKDRRVSDDDVPIIGDFSADADARFDAARKAAAARADAARTPVRAKQGTGTPPPGAAGPAIEQWRPDPGDVRRHARRIRERDGVGPVGRIFRFVVAGGILAAIVFGYFNFAALRAGVLELPFVAPWLDERAAVPGAPPTLPDESETVLVEPPRVVGVAEPSSDGGEPADERPAPALGAEPVAAPAAAAPVVAAVAEPAPPPDEPAPPPDEPAPPPEPPPGPETFALGSARVTVSEAAASAAVLVLRYGDTRRASSVVWFARDGTARAGSDYVDRGAVIERFAPGEQNRRILVPIVGDRNAEGPESFYVILTADDDKVPEGQIRETEVVITDDD